MGVAAGALAAAYGSGATRLEAPGDGASQAARNSSRPAGEMRRNAPRPTRRHALRTIAMLDKYKHKRGARTPLLAAACACARVAG